MLFFHKQSLQFLPSHVLDCLSEQSLQWHLFLFLLSFLFFLCCPLLHCIVEMDDSTYINNAMKLRTTDSSLETFSSFFHVLVLNKFLLCLYYCLKHSMVPLRFEKVVFHVLLLWGKRVSFGHPNM